MRDFSVQEKEMIDKMYKNGEKVEDIRFYLHCKYSTLQNYLNDNGYCRRARNTVNGKEKLSASRKYHFDEHYFETIDTEEKAYWFGFLCADGNVSFGKDKYGKRKGCTVELTLAEKDKNHLYKLIKCIGAQDDYPIKRRVVKLGDKEHIAYRLALNSVIMGNDLENKGCVPNKSLILKRPNIIPSLYGHFIRGYFDGDGCICLNEKLNIMNYSVVGTQDVLSFIQEVTGVSPKISIRQAKAKGEYRPFYVLNISGIKNVELFHDYVYKNANVYLERKYIKSCRIHEILSERKKSNIIT